MGLRRYDIQPPNGLLDGTTVSKPALRDLLRAERTALIDEADGIPEDLLTKRYSRASSFLMVKRSKGNGKFEDSTLDLFGATAIHRRKPFADRAVLGRSVV